MVVFSSNIKEVTQSSLLITDERWRRIEADTENGHGHDFNEERTPEQLKGEGGWDLKSLYKVRRKH